jgi:hypothetical protein
MTENLNQLREKQLLGVKYDYNEWSDVNYDYLLMSVIVNQKAPLVRGFGFNWGQQSLHGYSHQKTAYFD